MKMRRHWPLFIAGEGLGDLLIFQRCLIVSVGINEWSEVLGRA